MKRNGWTLVEMLSILVLLAAVLLVATRVFDAAVRDMPRAARTIHANRELAKALDRLRRDVEAGRSLPPATGDALFVALPEGTVGYRFGSDRIVRFRLTPQVKREVLDTCARGAKVTWRFREVAGRRRAVEVRSWIEWDVDGRPRKKLTNARVFFLGLLPERGKGR